MSQQQTPVTYPSPENPLPVRGWVYGLGALGVIIGVAAFILGALQPDPMPAWRALLVNFLFWSSVAQGSFTWAVAFRIAKTTWSAPVNRLGQAFVGYFIVPPLLLIVLFFGRHYIMPWLGADLGDRTRWLNAPFLFIRDEVGLLVLLVLALLYVRTYLRADATFSQGSPAGSDEERQTLIARTSWRLSVIGVIYLVGYFMVYTLIAFDLVMAINPIWHSALFGWYFALVGAYAGIAALAVLSVTLRHWRRVGRFYNRARFLDLGNFLMAFSLATAYFFFSQAIVIWYENLPHETSYIIPRVNFAPWRTLSIALLATCYLGVFALLVIREMKENPRTLLAVGLFALASIWFERYMLVTPSLSRAPTWSGVALVILIGLGFLGLMVLLVTPFLARYPAVSELDLHLREEQEENWA